MGVKRHIMPVDLPQSVSISGAEINLTVRAISTGVLCCNLAVNKSVLKICISKHFHEVTGFLLWIGTYRIGCLVHQNRRVKDLFSLVGYDDSGLAPIRHVKSIIRVVQPRPNIRSHSVSLRIITRHLNSMRPIFTGRSTLLYCNFYLIMHDNLVVF